MSVIQSRRHQTPLSPPPPVPIAAPKPGAEDWPGHSRRVKCLPGVVPQNGNWHLASLAPCPTAHHAIRRLRDLRGWRDWDLKWARVVLGRIVGWMRRLVQNTKFWNYSNSFRRSSRLKRSITALHAAADAGWAGGGAPITVISLHCSRYGGRKLQLSC